MDLPRGGAARIASSWSGIFGDFPDGTGRSPRHKKFKAALLQYAGFPKDAFETDNSPLTSYPFEQSVDGFSHVQRFYSDCCHSLLLSM